MTTKKESELADEMDRAVMADMPKEQTDQVEQALGEKRKALAGGEG